MSDEERNILNSYLYKGYKKDEFVYPLKSLRPPLRAWFRIIISCITPRPSGNSADYINIHQKYMLYCLCTDKKIFLPYTIFQHLRECINSSRTAGKMKDTKRKIKYIPFGRLISDLLTQNGLIQDILNTGLTEDLTEKFGDVLDGKNLDRMGVISELLVAPVSEDPKEIQKKHFMCDGFPMFYDHEPKEVIADYIYWLGEQGENIEGFTVTDVPRAASADLSSPPRVKSKKKKKAAATAKEEPPKKKKKSEPKKPSEQNVALKTNPASKSSRRSTRYLTSDISSESDTISEVSGSTSSSPSPSPQSSLKPISFLPPQSESTPTPPESPLKRKRKLKIKTTISKPKKSKPSAHSETQKETTQNQPPKTIPPSDQVPPVHEEDSQTISQLTRPPPEIQTETNPQQGDSDVTLSKYSDVNSSDLAFGDNSSTPPTKTIPQYTEPPTLYDYLGPSTPSEESFFEPIPPEYSDVQSSSYPVIDPSSAIVLYEPRPMHLVECINKSYDTVSKKALELLASTSAHPEREQAVWLEFQDWVNSETSRIIHSSEQAKELFVAAATKRRDEKLKAAQVREVLVMQIAQEAIEEEAKKRLEALQTQEEAERAEREEAARIETEKDEAARLETARMLAEEDAIIEDAIIKQLAHDQTFTAELGEKAKAEAERAEALKKAADKAKEAEDKGKAPMISDPRFDSLEKSVEELKADQKEFKEALKQHANSQKETRSILDIILQELRKSKP